MSQSETDDVIREIRSKIDLVQVVSEFVNLRKAGRTYTGLCPFHKERTPSFHVDPDKQLYHCFGCGAGGDVFSFIMNIKGLTFPEAVAELAKRAGITLPQRRDGSSPSVRRKLQEISNALQIALVKYQELLRSPGGKMAKEYLEKRGLTQEIVQKFGLGYSPPEWDFILSHGQKLGLSPKTMMEAGLLVERQSGGHYDRFRGRIMFPICDSLGDLIGFGGRSLGDDSPKYLNSPETRLFHKGKELYGLHLAKPAIRNGGTAVIVEGYMDVISCFQNGIDYAVAGMGTALTHDQVRTLLLISKKIVLAYDQDDAGKKAARKSIEAIRECGGRSYVAVYQEAKDPDEFLRKKGPDEFAKALEAAVPDVEYLSEIVTSGINVASVDGKIRAKEALVPVLAIVADEFELGAYLDEFARRLNVGKESLAKDVELYKRSGRQVLKYKKSENRDTSSYGNRNTSPESSCKKGLSRGNIEVDVSRRKAEEGVVRCLVEDSGLLERVKEYFDEEDFLDPDTRAVFQEISRGTLNSTENVEVLRYVAELCARFGPVERPEKILEDCLRRLRSYRLKELMELMMQAERNKDEIALEALRQDYNRLLKEIKSKG